MARVTINIPVTFKDQEAADSFAEYLEIATGKNNRDQALSAAGDVAKESLIRYISRSEVMMLTDRLRALFRG